MGKVGSFFSPSCWMHVNESIPKRYFLLFQPYSAVLLVRRISTTSTTSSIIRLSTNSPTAGPRSSITLSSRVKSSDESFSERETSQYGPIEGKEEMYLVYYIPARNTVKKFQL